MSVNAVSSSPTSLNLGTTKSKADESLQQLAQEGDPIAIAELKQQEQQSNPTQQTGPTEPGKGEQVDKYV
jgi:hypothetical protein